MEKELTDRIEMILTRARLFDAKGLADDDRPRFLRNDVSWMAAIVKDMCHRAEHAERLVQATLEWDDAHAFGAEADALLTDSVRAYRTGVPLPYNKVSTKLAVYDYLTDHPNPKYRQILDAAEELIDARDGLDQLMASLREKHPK